MRLSRRETEGVAPSSKCRSFSGVDTPPALKKKTTFAKKMWWWGRVVFVVSHLHAKGGKRVSQQHRKYQHPNDIFRRRHRAHCPQSKTHNVGVLRESEGHSFSQKLFSLPPPRPRPLPVGLCSAHEKRNVFISSSNNFTSRKNLLFTSPKLLFLCGFPTRRRRSKNHILNASS